MFTQRLLEPSNIYKNVSIPVGEYHWTRHQLTYGSPQDRRLTVSFFERFGTYYNGHLNEARVRTTYRAHERLSFSFAEQWNRFRLGATTDLAGNPLPAGSGNFSVVLGSFQTNYSFSRFLTLSALLQMDTANHQAASKYPPSLELPSGQRFVCDLHSRAAFRESGSRQSTTVLRESLHHQVHIFLAAMRKPCMERG